MQARHGWPMVLTVLAGILLAGTMPFAAVPSHLPDGSAPGDGGSGAPSPASAERTLGATRAAPYEVFLYLSTANNGTLSTGTPDSYSPPTRTAGISFSTSGPLHSGLTIAESTTFNLRLSVTNPDFLGSANVTMGLFDDSFVVDEEYTWELGPGDTQDNWELEFAGGHTFDAGSTITLSVRENDGANLQLQFGNAQTGYSRLTLSCLDHIPDDGFELMTLNADGLPDQEFEPNAAPQDRTVEFTGDVLDAFGSDDLESAQVSCGSLGLGPVEAELTAGPEGVASFSHLWEYDEGYDPGTYTWTVDVTDRSGNVISSDGTFVFQEYGVYVFTPSSFREAPAGGSVTYTVTVVNSGGRSDTFGLDANIGCSGWDAVPGEDEVDLGPGAEREVDLTVMVPEDGAAGTRCVATFSAASAGSGRADSLTLTTTVAASVGFSFALSGPSSAEVAPGDSADFGMTLENDGDSQEEYLVEVVHGPPGDWEYELLGGEELDPEGGYLLAGAVLDEGEELELVLTVTSPADPDVMRADTTLRAWPANDTSRMLWLNVTTRIEGSAGEWGLTLSVSSGTIRVEAIDSVTDTLRYEAGELTVTLSNSGDRDVEGSLSLEGVPSGWTARFTRSSLKVLPGKDEAVDLKVSPADDTPAGAVAVGIRVEAEGPDGTFTQTLDIEVDVVEFHRVSLRVLNSTDLKISGGDDRAAFTVKLTNTGNTKETVDLKFTSDRDWGVEFDPASTVKLDKGQTAKVRMVVAAPDGAGDGETATFSLSAAYGGGGTTEPVELSVEYEMPGVLTPLEFLLEFWPALLLLIILIIMGVMLKLTMSRDEGDGKEDDPGRADGDGTDEGGGGVGSDAGAREGAKDGEKGNADGPNEGNGGRNGGAKGSGKGSGTGSARSRGRAGDAVVMEVTVEPLDNDEDENDDGAPTGVGGGSRRKDGGRRRKDGGRKGGPESAGLQI